eukprot:GHVN01030563.1.p1 GENE.GHVN01030563.1~~GHVN01030563.1.p1  ORF type:complete len:246 (+),score=48.08 GHVN01030563.1:154-891(+)
MNKTCVVDKAGTRGKPDESDKSMEIDKTDTARAVAIRQAAGNQSTVSHHLPIKIVFIGLLAASGAVCAKVGFDLSPPPDSTPFRLIASGIVRGRHIFNTTQTSSPIPCLPLVATHASLSAHMSPSFDNKGETGQEAPLDTLTSLVKPTTLWITRIIFAVLTVIINIKMVQLWVSALQESSASQVTISSFVINFITTGIMGLVVFGEDSIISFRWVVGAVMMCAGVFLVNADEGGVSPEVTRGKTD